MKTILPVSINTIEEAKAFLTELNKNGESYHPEDNANDLVGGLFTNEEGEQLNKLMSDIYALEDNNSAMDMSFDPCAFLLWLDMPEFIKFIDLDFGSSFEVEKNEAGSIFINGWEYEKNLSSIELIKKPFKQPTYA